jgi:hypothetical protein
MIFRERRRRHVAHNGWVEEVNMRKIQALMLAGVLLLLSPLAYSKVRNLAWEEGHRKLSSIGKPNERRVFTTMAQRHYKGLFKKALLQFVTEPDPVLAMLEWVAGQMMLIEAEAKVGAEKGKHSKVRTTHFSGKRVRRMDTRLEYETCIFPLCPEP